MRRERGTGRGGARAPGSHTELAGFMFFSLVVAKTHQAVRAFVALGKMAIACAPCSHTLAVVLGVGGG